MRYGVQGSTVGDRTVQMVSGGGTTQTTISGLTPSTTYSIEVAAVNSAGVGVYSERICYWGTYDILKYDIHSPHGDMHCHLHMHLGSRLLHAIDSRNGCTCTYGSCHGTACSG